MSKNDIALKEDLSKLLIYSIDDDAKFEYLLLNGANINYQTTNGWSAMFQAIVSKKNMRLRNIIDLGSDVNQRDKSTKNALFWAIYSGNIAAFNLLLSKGISLNVFLKDKLHALHYSVYKGRLDFVKSLIKNRAVDINLCDHLEANPFLYAVLYKHKNLIDFFSKNKADKYKQDIFGNSAYSLSKEYGIKI
ncbi:ankyrin repeat domain-containing protein [Campylobacterota bacterium DY0563]